MLTKPPIVTVIPAVPGRDYVPAMHTCSNVPPPGVGGGDYVPPPVTPPPSGYTPDPGAGILLETADGAGGFTYSTSVAPAPAGYVCRIEDPSNPHMVDGATVLYSIVCTGGP